MTPSRPYIMRALYEWIVDNNCTPYVLVDATVADVMVPQQYVKDGQIVLNISPGAVIELNIGNDSMAFNGRFGGVATDIYVPIAAVVGVFEPEESTGPPHEPPPDPIKPEGRPSLKIVK